jgi:dolichol-phosphate mannosyltransferase
MAFQLSIIVPTLNESGNVQPLLEKLDRALDGVAWEIIFVDDDSSDSTAALVRRISQVRENVRCLQRVGRRGLSSACVEGMMASSTPYLAVMDADLQHDETLLPAMFHKLMQENLDIVIASRFAAGSSLGSFSSSRERLSRVGNRLSRAVSKADLSDPLSGFFVLRRELLEEVVHSLSCKGFKILLDIFASSERPLKYGEVAMRFRERHSGESKLNVLVMLEFIMLLADKTFGRFVPVRFILFVMVGLFGVLVHLSVLGVCYKLLHVSFRGAQTAAALVAIGVNFYFDNQFTYRDQRLKGVRFMKGLLLFYVACFVGAIINYSVAISIFRIGFWWPIAGALGAVVGSVWNYGVTSTFTWGESKRPAKTNVKLEELAGRSTSGAEFGQGS